MVSSPLMRKPSLICNSPRVRRNRSLSSKPTAKSKCSFEQIRRPLRSSTTRWSWIWEPLRPRSLVPSVRRIASRCARPRRLSQKSWKERRPRRLPSETTATRLTFRAARWSSRHHQLHQHFKSFTHAGRWPACEESGRARFARQALGQDQPGARLESRDDYLLAAGLTPYLEKLNFHLVGMVHHVHWKQRSAAGAIGAAIKDNNLIAVAVLSGNRNFEGRIHPLVRANYLASPPLVVAYALAGRMDLDLTTEPLGTIRRANRSI